MNETSSPTRKRSRPSRPLILRSEDGQDFTVDYEDLLGLGKSIGRDDIALVEFDLITSSNL